LDNHWHGVVAKKVPSGRTGFVIEQVEDNSPAAEGGLQPGDEITAVETHQVARALDFERALLGRKTGEPIEVVLRRSDRPLKLSLVLASPPARARSLDDRVWDVIGLRLRTIPANQFRTLHPRYRGGLRITAVRPDSAADEQGIRTSDILVGMHIWETVSLDNVAYVLKRIDENRLSPLKFWVLRGNQPFFGYLTVADRRGP
jgi:serine protease Do